MECKGISVKFAQPLSQEVIVRNKQTEMRYSNDNPPPDLKSAIERRQELVQRKNSIIDQLRDRNKLDPDTGKRVGSKEYWQWRNKACHAMTWIDNELVFLKGWIGKRRADKTISDAGYDPNDPKSLLVAAFEVIEKVESRFKCLDARDMQLKMAIRDYLSHNL